MGAISPRGFLLGTHSALSVFATWPYHSWRERSAHSDALASPSLSVMVGTSPSAVGAAPLPPSHQKPPAAKGHGGADDHADDDTDNNNNNSNNSRDASFPLLDLLERFPDLFAQQVLVHLDPIDRTFLAQTGGAYRAAVAASDLPRVGTMRGLTLVHVSAQLERSLWNRGCAQGLCSPC